MTGIAYHGLPVMERAPLDHLRAFALTGAPRVSVEELLPPTSLPDWQKNHVAALFEKEGEWQGVLSLYGSLHRVRLGAAVGALPHVEHLAAICAPGKTVTLHTGPEAAMYCRRLDELARHPPDSN
jgi:hypothetical protein